MSKLSSTHILCMEDSLEPCVTCRLYSKHGCFLQSNCARVHRWRQQMIERSLNAYRKEVIDKNRLPQNSRPTKNYWKIEGA